MSDTEQTTNTPMPPVTEQDSGPEGCGRDRKALAAEVELHPGSLVGSWFHKLEADEMVWQGIVVAEPQPGTYLVEVDGSIPGASKVQRVVCLDAMEGDVEDGFEWRFYDTDEQMREAFAEWSTNRRIE